MDTDERHHLLDSIGEDAVVVFDVAADIAARLPEATLAMRDLQAFVVAHAEPATTCRDLRRDPLAIELFLRLSATSRYGLDTVMRAPGDFWQIVQERQFRQRWGRRTLVEFLTKELGATADREARLRILPRFKHRHFLRVMLGDLTGDLTFESVVAELSDITDALAQAALALAMEEWAPRFGHLALRQAATDHGKASGFYRVDVPEPAPLTSGFTVLAMGKLGGRELNYSSDIDLIFVYHVASDADPERDWHAAFTALGRMLIPLLERPDGGAQLFRVDMRLRPEGERGELALSLRETVDYYYSVGRPWERQALIKVRPIAGDRELGQRLLDELRPWVYPQDPDWATLDEARCMRRRIEERARDRDVKTGAGGIRDIEFLVQFFQRCYGGRQPELRLRATLPMLHLLTERGILPRGHVADLRAAYIWLRTVEHRLQMREDRQEHEVPVDPEARRQLAWAVAEMDLAAFDARLAQVRARVRELVALHFLAVGKEQDAMLALVVQGEAEAGLAQRVLGGFGFRDIPRAALEIRALATEPFFVLSRHRTERALVALLPELLHRIAQAPSPDQALTNLVRIAAAVGGRATFFEMLTTRLDLLDLFTGFAGWANYLVELFACFPGLTDEIIDALSTRPRPLSVLTSEARALVQGLQNPTEPLAFMLARESAVTALRDLAGLDQSQVSRRLSALAEAIIDTVLGRLVLAQTHAWGAPVEAGRPTRFVLLGLGKLGGHEMTYASDLDVICVCDPGGRCSRHDRDGEAFWTAVTQELMRTTSEGRLYEIDPRLRPWGEQGQLVVNTRALADYWAEPRELWERMAMLRVGILAGDARLGEEVLALIRQAAYAAPLPADALTQVLAMRRRLEQSVVGKDHLKRGPGGYVDHEFIAQFFSLGLPAQEVLAASGSVATADVLKGLARLGRIPSQAADELIPGLELLRFIEARMRLSAGRAISTLPTTNAERIELARRCDFATLDAFNAAVAHARATARRWFVALIG